MRGDWSPRSSRPERAPARAVDFAELEDLDWQRDGPGWPLSAHSRFVTVGALRWHVQQCGAGPPLVLLHGTGSSTHSWAALAPLLARQWTVCSMDLPGHGFTRGRPSGGLALPAVAAALAMLLDQLAVRAPLLVGHSAGAAIAVRAALDRRLEPRGIVSLNGALLPFSPLLSLLSAPLARALALVPGTATLFARHARRRSALQRLIDSTGSTLPAEGVDRYWRLVRSPQHVAGVIDMMAHWDLAPLARDLRLLRVPLLQVVGSKDGTVSPRQAHEVAARVAGARTVVLDGLGHLAHEEDPARVARAIEDWAGTLP
jgi:magnesium chelatase accessory protein